MQPRLQRIAPWDVPVLHAWRDGADLRLARRAWIVLEDADGRSVVDLAEATGLPSRTVQRLVRAYRRDGLLGVLDAPRSGRPTKSPPSFGITAGANTRSARAVADQFGVSRDVVWRRARLNGSPPRERGKSTRRLDGRRLRTVTGVFAAEVATVMMVESSPSLLGGLRSLGIRKTFGRQAGSQRRKPELVDWRTELELARDTGGTATPRALAEAVSWFLIRTISPGPGTTILIAGDPTRRCVVDWLVALKARLTTSVDGQSPWAVRCAITLEDWGAALKEHGLVDVGLPGLTWPREGSPPFIWARTPQRQSFPA